MTDLLIDVGNSRTKWILAEDGHVRGAARAVGHDDLVPLYDEWAALRAAPQRVRGVSVGGGEAVAAIDQWITDHWGLAPQWLQTPALGGGIRVAYADPGQLGTDRWLAMVGARAADYLPACIVDCGSAITLDVVDSQGRHQGGLILPGLSAQQAGLASVAPRLPTVDLATKTPFLTNNTHDALASGYLHGTAMALQGLIRRAMAASTERLTPLFTGGDATLIARYLDMDVRLRPDLVLEGLASIP
ncbi:type III pantothenate kinase [Spiribacter insolitus]|uniref:Type III pantothenate kinase n=1 Tax=Spiribacter insolitus TaxID=3122417 RepID=A0ABV3T8Z6_9GAMM